VAQIAELYRRKEEWVNTENRHDGTPKPAVRRRHWKRIHHSRLFWVGAFLFLAAITIYVLSDDLSWRPSNPISVAEPEYSSKIVGDWQGEVAGTNETISFGADGRFVSLARTGGFISMTLSQGATGTVRGTWAIKGKTITLNINSTEDDRALNSVATATIETFKPNELIVKSGAGITSTFIR
jgi:hypothetical protein